MQYTCSKVPQINPMLNKDLKPTRSKNGKKKAKKEGSEGYQEN